MRVLSALLKLHGKNPSHAPYSLRLGKSSEMKVPPHHFSWLFLKLASSRLDCSKTDPWHGKAVQSASGATQNRNMISRRSRNKLEQAGLNRSSDSHLSQMTMRMMDRSVWSLPAHATVLNSFVQEAHSLCTFTWCSSRLWDNCIPLKRKAGLLARGLYTDPLQ